MEMRKKSGKLSPRIVIIILVLLGVVYAISVYTKNHEKSDTTTPNLTETPLKQGKGIK